MRQGPQSAPSTKSASSTKSTYPFAADILLTLPFLIDTVGNAVDFYDSIWWWDDVNHLVNWALLAGAVGALAWRSKVRPWQTLAYVVGSARLPQSCGKSQSTSLLH